MVSLKMVPCLAFTEGRTMVDLFLSFPGSDSSAPADEDAQLKKRIRLLERLEPIIWSIITADGRSEARLWLCNAIASINAVPSHSQSALFSDLLHSSMASEKAEGTAHALATRIMRMICENRPDKVGKIIAQKSRLLRRFFRGQPKRVLKWFDHFAGIGEVEHKRGARAISQFAFVNRDICWDELEWRGRHGQSPAMVATKPHYFLDLDVLRTVENLVENVPDFWSSEEFTESVRDGEILSVDMEFFVEELFHMMYNEDSLEVQWVVDEFLSEEKFSSLCQHLLILLSDEELMTFLNAVGKIIVSIKNDNGSDSKQKINSKLQQFNWLETVMSAGIKCQSMNDLLLTNACINKARQILRRLQDEEHEEEKRKLEDIVMETKQSFNNSGHWVLRRECLRVNKWMAIKWLALESFVLQCHLVEECKTAACCETLFVSNAIKFRHSSISFVDCDEFSGKERSVRSLGHSKRFRKKRKHNAKKKRKWERSLKGHSSSSGNEEMDMEYCQKWENSEMEERNWLLSTDDYASPWNKSDLPEYLSVYSISSWLKSVISSWSS